ncbi:MAG TPA: tRNA (guanosine(37)-N1)-methyltransferase TrmD [Vicinamibacterales bacterium]|nr:tRNA (guanosine(37)-N1)-methyltransferase TrmD [Vicinamibacterales bacterium]
MKVDIITIFPRMVEAALGEGIVARARARGLLDIVIHDLRDFTTDRHRVVDDVPFGGGPGMVLKPEPVFLAVDRIQSTRGALGAVLLTSPAGKVFSRADARRLAATAQMTVICGRYEGVDDRVRQHVATEEVSIGDYVVSGGELPALVIVDAVSRWVPGVVGDEESVEADSFERGLLDYPHFTRPAEFRGYRVPDVLVSGHHGEIRRWRRRQAIERTLEQRPDLLRGAALDEEEREILRDIERARARE